MQNTECRTKNAGVCTAAIICLALFAAAALGAEEGKEENRISSDNNSKTSVNEKAQGQIEESAKSAKSAESAESAETASDLLLKERFASKKDPDTNKDKLARYISLIRAASVDEDKNENQSAPQKKNNIQIGKKTETQAKPEDKIVSQKDEWDNTGQVLSEEIIEKIRTLTNDPTKAEDPYMLAEILFRCGYLNQACVFYEEALRRMNEESQNQNGKDWLLLQIGNCYKKEKKQLAIEAYRRLINEVPDSAWIDIARTQVKLLTWYVENNIDTLTLKNQDGKVR